MTLSLWTQLFGLGLLWITLHCGGMCGPIMLGLVSTQRAPRPGASRRALLLARAGDVLAYQLGRALIYAGLGALAAALGLIVQQHVKVIAQGASLLSALLIIALALSKLVPRGKRVSTSTPAASKLLGRCMRVVSRRWPDARRLRMGVMGMLLAMLPCSLAFWVLGLALSAGSVWEGALLMVGLVVLTTPALLGAACTTTLVSARMRRKLAPLVPLALLGTGVWMLLITLAYNGVIDHLHFNVQLGGAPYHIMLF